MPLKSEKNARKGKLHEILLGNYLEYGIEQFDNYSVPKRPNGIREHYVFKEDETLKITHRKIVAASAANFISERLPKIHDVYWTSNKKDISVLLGFPEYNPSDLVVIQENGDKIGISVKLKESNGLTNLGNKGSDSVNKIFGIDTESVLKPYRTVLYEAAKCSGIEIPTKKRDNFIRENLVLKEISRRMKNAGYGELANIIRNKIKDYSNDDLALLIREGIGYDRKPAFPVYMIETIDKKNSLVHRFVDSYEETCRILYNQRPYLKLGGKNRNLNILGKGGTILCKIEVNSRSSGILSNVQFRWWAWGKEYKI